jgi:hypothetical protein
MFDSAHEASFAMPEGLTGLMAALEETWPAHLAEIRASGVPTNETPEPGATAVEEPAGFEPAGGAPAEPAAGTPAEPEEPAQPEEPGTPAAPERDIQAELEQEWLREQEEARARRDAELAAALQRLAAPQAEGAGAQTLDLSRLQLEDEFGNINPAALLEAVHALNQHTLSPIQQQMNQLAEQIQQARAEAVAEQRHEQYGELVEDMFANNIARHGDLTTNPEDAEKATSFVEARAMQLLPGLNAKYGTNPDGSAKPRVLEAAIEQAAGEVRELLTGHASSTTEQERNRLATLAAAGGEPGAAGVGGVTAPVIKLGETSASKFANR